MRSDGLFLQDILDAVDVIEQYLPANSAAFDADAPLRSHLYRHIMIIGEAAYRLSKELKDRNSHVPWRRMEGMRHILVHDYFKVDWDAVYSTAATDVPALKPQIEQVLQSLPPEKQP